jgi:hypothetical protein
LTEAFLEDVPSRGPWPAPAGSPQSLKPYRYWLGGGDVPLEVLYATSPNRPTYEQVRRIWSRWRNNRAAPVLLIVGYATPSGQKAVACGASGEDPTPWDGLDLGQIERLAKTALAEPDRNLAIRLIHNALPEAKSALPGVTNSGYLSTHELSSGVPSRDDWLSNLSRSVLLLNSRGKSLVTDLGFTIHALSPSSSVLRVDGMT